jgi:hypothetical protein
MLLVDRCVSNETDALLFGIPRAFRLPLNLHFLVNPRPLHRVESVPQTVFIPMYWVP